MDCHICYDKKPSLKTLPCEHSLCSNCYLRLDNTICPFCRESFSYTAEEIKQRAKIGLKYGYQSNELQPGLSLPDEFVLNGPSQLLSNLYGGVISHLSPNLIFRRNQRIENQYLMLEDGIGSTRSKKHKKYHDDSIPSRLTVDEINDRRYNIAKREFKKWSRKDQRLNKINSCFYEEVF